jgi:hypothetical protein
MNFGWAPDARRNAAAVRADDDVALAGGMRSETATLPFAVDFDVEPPPPTVTGAEVPPPPTLQAAIAPAKSTNKAGFQEIRTIPNLLDPTNGTVDD